MSRIQPHTQAHLRAAAAAASVAVALALAGCAPAASPRAAGSSHPSPVARATATARPTPTAAAPGSGPLPANALFRITATVTEPDGTSAALVQTVFAPSAPTTSDTALLDAQCNLTGQPAWESSYTSPQYITTTVTATMLHGSSWPTTDQVSSYFLGSSSAYSGAYALAQSDCAPGYIGIPGTMHGVAPVEAASPATGTYGWASAFGMYGFDGGGNDPGAEDSSGTAVVSNCAIQESAAAQAASPVVEGWLTQPFVAAKGCQFDGA
jgi:hypothetical protein